MTQKQIKKEFDQGIKDAQNALNSVVEKVSLDYSSAYAIGVIHVLERCADGLKNLAASSATSESFEILSTLLKILENDGEAADEKEE